MVAIKDYHIEYLRWIKKAVADLDVAQELNHIKDNDAAIEDAFYCDLSFGTGGLRGVIGAGTNRMNVFTVAKASQGLANYVNKHFPIFKRKIAISYDSRIKSELFAKTAAGVFAANGIDVAFFSELMPTPCLSYAVRTLDCAAGIMVTASHNPARYNGYKVHNSDGCQITTKIAEEISFEIEKLDIFSDIKQLDFDTGVKNGKIGYISQDVFRNFIEEVKAQSVLFGEEIDEDVSIVYSPLNGTGLKPVLTTLNEVGFTKVTVVKEQAQPNGEFPTCPYPNPEMKEAMKLGMEYAEKVDAELVLATDPDCDRVGIAVQDAAGEMVLLTGNETGMLLFDYICSQRIKHGKMPENPILVKTIVTSDMAERIAAKYGVRSINVLTGFKFIGEQIGLLEAAGKVDSYIFGFEESYGYLSGTYVRDKDAVSGTYLICEMFAYYKSRGISLFNKLAELYDEYGCYLNTLHSYEFEGIAGLSKMHSIMKKFKNGIEKIGPKRVIKILDYAEGRDGLPKSNVLKYMLEDDCSVVIRPSGTEPKMKVYISISAEDRGGAKLVEEKIVKVLNTYFVCN